MERRPGRFRGGGFSIHFYIIRGFRLRILFRESFASTVQIPTYSLMCREFSLVLGRQAGKDNGDVLTLCVVCVVVS